MLTLQSYWAGKAANPARTIAVAANAEELLNRVNSLMVRFGEIRKIVSGWRPPEVNAKLPGAAINSKHITGQAVDLADPDGDLDQWCLDNPNELERFQLWLEHPATTKNVCHLQSVPPKSGKRVFYP